MSDSQTIYPDMMDADYCYGALVGGRATAAEQRAAARHLRELMDEVEYLQNTNNHVVMQAQMQAQEARTQRSIVMGIGSIVGCVNDWEMVDAVAQALCLQANEQAGHPAQLVNEDGELKR